MSCGSVSISNLQIADQIVNFDINSQTLAMSMSDIVSGLNNAACPTYCSLTTLNDLPAYCAGDLEYSFGQDECYCGTDRLIYFHHYNSGIEYDVYDYIIPQTDPTTCTSTNFQIHDQISHTACYYYDGQYWQGSYPTVAQLTSCGNTAPCYYCSNSQSHSCYCSKTYAELEVSGQASQTGSTFTIDILGYNSLTRCEEELEFYCFKGSTANSDYGRFTSNNFKVKHQCDSSTPYISELITAGREKQSYNNLDLCTFALDDTEVFLSLPLAIQDCTGCRIIELKAFRDPADTTPTGCDMVSQQYRDDCGNGVVPGYASDTFWRESTGWRFDGLPDIGSESYRRRTDYSFYVRAKQISGATYWLGGSGSETQFRLFCDVCKYCSVNSDGDPKMHFYGLETQTGSIINQYELNDYRTVIDDWFSAACSQPLSNTLCDAIHLTAYENIGLTVTLTGTQIALSPADNFDNFQGNPSLQDLSLQTLTVDTSSPFKRQIYIKGMNTGNEYNHWMVDVIVCGNEVITANSSDFAEINLIKHLGYTSPGAQNPQTEIYYTQSDLETGNWFTESFNSATSSAECFSLGTRTYSLCLTIDSTGNSCQIPWNSPTQLSKLELISHSNGDTDLRINLNPFNEVELHLLIYYSMGKIAASRKLKVAVCGFETIHGYQNDTTLLKNNGVSEILQKLTFEYEIGSGMDGSNSTFVIDSVGLLNTTNNNITDMYFVSSNQVNCPVFDCDIVTSLEYDEQSGEVSNFTSNHRPSTIQIFPKNINSVNDGLGFQVHIDTSDSFKWEKYWIRAFSASNYDTPVNNSYLQLDLQVIDCSQEEVSILDPNIKFELKYYVNDTVPTNVTIGGKFESSHPHFCPITSYNVTKIMDVETNQPKPSKWFQNLFIGDSDDINLVNSRRNLVIQYLSEPYEVKVHIAALTGNVSSNTTEHLVHIKVEMPPNYRPVFFVTPNPHIFVDLNTVRSQLFKEKLPEIYDKNIWDQVEVVIQAENSINNLLSYDTEDGCLQIKGLREEHIGFYDIQIYLVDQNNGSTLYEFDINITKQQVTFDKEFLIHEDVQEEQITSIQNLFDSERPIQARILNIDQVGQMNIKFTQLMETESCSFGEIEESIQLKLEPFQILEDFDESLLSYKYNVTSFRDDELIIKIKFAHPLYISQYLIRDQMLVIFNNRTCFQSISGNSFEKSKTIIMQTVPKLMIDDVNTQNLISTATIFDLILNVMFWILLAFNILFGGTAAMDHFVHMINTLQIVMHIPLFSLVLPGNFILFLQKIIPIVMFDIVKEEWSINPTNMMQFDEDGNQFTNEEQAGMFPSQIQDLGYESHNFIQNVGSMYLFLSIYILKLFILGLFTLWKKYVGMKPEIYNKLYQQVIFSDLIILFLEGYLEFCIACFIRYHSNKPIFSDTGLPAEVFSDTLCTICIFIIIVLIPCFILYTVTRSTQQVAQPEFKDKFGVFTKGLNIKKRFATSYYLIFMTRRLFFLSIAFYAFPVPVFQIQFLCFLNLIIAIYQGLTKSNENKLLNYQETYNEFWTQAMTVQLFYFVGDYKSSQESSYSKGFTIIASLSFLIITNLLVVFWYASKVLLLFLFKYYLRFELKCDRILYKFQICLKRVKRKISALDVLRYQVDNEEPTDLNLPDNLLKLQNQTVAQDNFEFSFRGNFSQRQQNQKYKHHQFSDKEIEREMKRIEKEIVTDFMKGEHKSQDNLVNQESSYPADIKKSRLDSQIEPNKRVRQESRRNSLVVELMEKNVYGWSLTDSLLWLKLDVKLPQYSRNFIILNFDGNKLLKTSEQEIVDCLSPMPLQDKIILCKALSDLKNHQIKKELDQRKQIIYGTPPIQHAIQSQGQNIYESEPFFNPPTHQEPNNQIQNLEKKMKPLKPNPSKDKYLKPNRKYLHDKFSDKEIEQEMKRIEAEFKQNKFTDFYPKNEGKE